MITATLTEKRWCGRTLLVRCDDEIHTVQFSPWGWNRESVLVDGAVAVRRSGGHRISHGYRFRLGDAVANLSVAMPLWAELFLRDFTFVRLEVDGAVLYEEGRAPDQPLQWTVAVEGFPVVFKSASPEAHH